MFEDWKKAWQEAVENFRYELNRFEEGTAPADERLRAMDRDLAAARQQLRKLEQELRGTRQEIGEEQEAERVCRRREALARGIGDQDTARVAAEFATRHAERAVLLGRKVEILEAERALRARDLEEMETQLRQRVQTAQQRSAIDQAARASDADHDAQDEEFRRLEREARERAASSRLEELKRRMR